MRKRAPRLAALCEEINRRFPHLEAQMEDWSGSFDRHPKGVRWRIPGKRLRCKILVVRRHGEVWGRPIYKHNPLEAYRCNADVLRWIEYDAPKIPVAGDPANQETRTEPQE